MTKRWIKTAEESGGYGVKSVETYKCMPYRTLDLQPNQNPIAIEESDERMKTGYMFGGFIGTGTAVLLGRADNMGWFLKWAMGAVDAGTPQNELEKHIFTQGEAVKSFTLEEDIGETLGRFLTGCVMKRLTLESVMTGPMLMTQELQYQKETLDTSTGIGSPLPAIRPFALHDAVVQAPSGTTLKAESIRLNIENTIPDDAHTSGSRYLPDISLEGLSINGELELRFESWAQRQRFYGAAVSEPTTPQDEVRTVDLGIVWTGPSAGVDDYRLDVILPAVMLTENPITTTMRERLKQRLTFEAIYHSSNAIHLYSADANYSDI